MDDNSDLDQSLKDWAELSGEYADLEELHKTYHSKLTEVIALQKKCISGVNHQRYRLNAVKKMLGHVGGDDTLAEEEQGAKKDLEKDLLRRKAQLSQMEDTLPRPSGRYLNIILGKLT